MKHVPRVIQSDLKAARRLEWWTLFWQATIVGVMFFAMGSSQAMKSAWIEDLLGLLPAGVFLLALHYEQKPPTERFPYGFARLNSLAFLVAAAALLFMGLWLIYDSGIKLLHAEHPTIGAAPVFGPDVWMGWVMVAALAYSVVPPIILGRMKQPLARRLQDKVLYTDALMQKADWMTGLAGAAGVIGVGLGFWWADSVAALLIALDIVNDGRRSLVIAASELADGTPRALEKNQTSEEAKRLRERLKQEYGASEVRMRESGRYILADVDGMERLPESLDAIWPDRDRKWRLAGLSRAARIRLPWETSG